MIDGHAVLVFLVFCLAGGLWLSSTANRFLRRRVLGIGPDQRLAIAVFGGLAILALNYLPRWAELFRVLGR